MEQRFLSQIFGSNLEIGGSEAYGQSKQREKREEPSHDYYYSNPDFDYLISFCQSV